ncbi:hypothetical protein M422DRAFT_254324 [Sphaerobolus stellatus SS14]|uniref:Secreted protein n=1 Tax=Sphaerobolus stellatus (strain SS14) TaxID=990650 RepID=A0A0C9VVB6_SPHS4|nr:hypothetical protein M422DRAFT_254324 [Sphaerobolus stellatus SS14]
MARRASVRTRPPLSPLLLLAIFLLTIAEEDEEELLALLVFFGTSDAVEVMSAFLGSPWKEYHKRVFGNVHTWCVWVGAGCQMAAGRPLKKLMATPNRYFSCLCKNCRFSAQKAREKYLNS